MGEEADLLDGVADVPAQLVGVEAEHVLAADADLAGGRLDQPVDHLHGGRLAAAGRADQHDELSCGDVEGDVVDRWGGLPRVVLGQRAQFDAHAFGVTVEHEAPSGW
ncbi:hypothetical protein GCM10009733_011370 [Nonomuraea maheshkhaliensis]|uniref:Uncharacterized protein n=1 Tax=Nonomuraea maheshkhaliensis TaxID=419590 RepID=A0ABP4QQC0_9ACTN